MKLLKIVYVSLIVCMISGDTYASAFARKMGDRFSNWFNRQGNSNITPPTTQEKPKPLIDQKFPLTDAEKGVFDRRIDQINTFLVQASLNDQTDLSGLQTYLENMYKQLNNTNIYNQVLFYVIRKTIGTKNQNIAWLLQEAFSEQLKSLSNALQIEPDYISQMKKIAGRVIDVIKVYEDNATRTIDLIEKGSENIGAIKEFIDSQSQMYKKHFIMHIVRQVYRKSEKYSKVNLSLIAYMIDNYSQVISANVVDMLKARKETLEKQKAQRDKESKQDTAAKKEVDQRPVDDTTKSGAVMQQFDNKGIDASEVKQETIKVLITPQVQELLRENDFKQALRLVKKQRDAIAVQSHTDKLSNQPVAIQQQGRDIFERAQLVYTLLKDSIEEKNTSMLNAFAQGNAQQVTQAVRQQLFDRPKQPLAIKQGRSVGHVDSIPNTSLHYDLNSKEFADLSRLARQKAKELGLDYSLTDDELVEISQLARENSSEWSVDYHKLLDFYIKKELKNKENIKTYRGRITKDNQRIIEHNKTFEQDLRAFGLSGVGRWDSLIKQGLDRALASLKSAYEFENDNTIQSVYADKRKLIEDDGKLTESEKEQELAALKNQHDQDLAKLKMHYDNLVQAARRDVAEREYLAAKKVQDKWRNFKSKKNLPDLQKNKQVIHDLKQQGDRQQQPAGPLIKQRSKAAGDPNVLFKNLQDAINQNNATQVMQILQEEKGQSYVTGLINESVKYAADKNKQDIVQIISDQYQDELLKKTKLFLKNYLSQQKNVEAIQDGAKKGFAKFLSKQKELRQQQKAYKTAQKELQKKIIDQLSKEEQKAAQDIMQEQDKAFADLLKDAQQDLDAISKDAALSDQANMFADAERDHQASEDQKQQAALKIQSGYRQRLSRKELAYRQKQQAYESAQRELQEKIDQLPEDHQAKFASIMQEQDAAFTTLLNKSQQGLERLQKIQDKQEELNRTYKAQHVSRNKKKKKHEAQKRKKIGEKKAQQKAAKDRRIIEQSKTLDNPKYPNRLTPAEKQKRVDTNRKQRNDRADKQRQEAFKKRIDNALSDQANMFDNAEQDYQASENQKQQAALKIQSAYRQRLARKELARLRQKKQAYQAAQEEFQKKIIEQLSEEQQKTASNIMQEQNKAFEKLLKNAQQDINEISNDATLSDQANMFAYAERDYQDSEDQKQQLQNQAALKIQSAYRQRLARKELARLGKEQERANKEAQELLQKYETLQQEIASLSDNQFKQLLHKQQQIAQGVVDQIAANTKQVQQELAQQVAILDQAVVSPKADANKPVDSQHSYKLPRVILKRKDKKQKDFTESKGTFRKWQEKQATKQNEPDAALQDDAIVSSYKAKRVTLKPKKTPLAHSAVPQFTALTNQKITTKSVSTQKLSVDIKNALRLASVLHSDMATITIQPRIAQTPVNNVQNNQLPAQALRLASLLQTGKGGSDFNQDLQNEFVKKQTVLEFYQKKGIHKRK